MLTYMYVAQLLNLSSSLASEHVYLVRAAMFVGLQSCCIRASWSWGQGSLPLFSVCFSPQWKIAALPLVEGQMIANELFHRYFIVITRLQRLFSSLPTQISTFVCHIGSIEKVQDDLSWKLLHVYGPSFVNISQSRKVIGWKGSL